LLLLALAIPLPYYLQVALTSELQLVSSRLGVLAIAAMGIPVFLEGNLIDLGTYKLQVLEACSGLSYLFPLLSFAVMCACLFRGSAWQRAFIVLLAVPITILMNSLRIAVAGLLVDGYGPATAEGFIHNFEGWLVFVVSLALLFGAMALLVRLGSGPARTLQEALDLGIPELPRARAPMHGRSSPAIVACTALLVVGATGVFAFTHRGEQIPARTPLALFPSTIGDRHGHRGMLDRDTIRTLRLDDYYLAEYSATADAEPVELYLAYYDSQRDGSSPHSPKVCLPAGGWEIERFERSAVDVSTGAPVSLNRVVMHKGTHRLLAYYWFQQRGYTFANEYRMKWHLLKDAVLLNRTDGALVRLVTPIDADLATSEKRLDAFLRDLWIHLPPFIPN
jgi:exosortase D (VPLPA-CTERM-specific)